MDKQILYSRPMVSLLFTRNRDRTYCARLMYFEFFLLKNQKEVPSTFGHSSVYIYLKQTFLYLEKDDYLSVRNASKSLNLVVLHLVTNIIIKTMLLEKLRNIILLHMIKNLLMRKTLTLLYISPYHVSIFTISF